MNRILVAVTVCALGWTQAAFAQDDLAAVDKLAPNFRLPVYNSQAVGATFIGLDKFVGPDATDTDTKIVLLSFMASFCAPCKKEMPYLQSLHEKYKDFGLRVMMVSIDTEPEGQKQIDELIALNKVTFPVLKDRFNLVARRWLGTQSPLPSVFMIKPDGIVSMVHRGYNQEASEVFAAEVETAMGIKRGTSSTKVAKTETPAEDETKTVAQPAAGHDEGAVQPASGNGNGNGNDRKRAPKKPAKP